MKRRTVEVFSAGCPCCADAVKLVQQLACPSCDVQVLDMGQSSTQAKAKRYGVNRVPAVAIDGVLAECCSQKGVDEASLRTAGLGRAL